MAFTPPDSPNFFYWSQDYRLRRRELSTGLVTSVQGTGAHPASCQADKTTAQMRAAGYFGQLMGLAGDKAGNLIIADRTNTWYDTGAGSYAFADCSAVYMLYRLNNTWFNLA